MKRVVSAVMTAGVMFSGSGCGESADVYEHFTAQEVVSTNGGQAEFEAWFDDTDKAVLEVGDIAKVVPSHVFPQDSLSSVQRIRTGARYGAIHRSPIAATEKGYSPHSMYTRTESTVGYVVLSAEPSEATGFDNTENRINCSNVYLLGRQAVERVGLATDAYDGVVTATLGNNALRLCYNGTEDAHVAIMISPNT